MSLWLQAVFPGVSVPGYSSVREIRVWGAIGVSEASLVWASESLNKKERQPRKIEKIERKERNLERIKKK